MAFAIVIKTLEMTRTKESYLDEGDTKGVGSQVRLDLLEELTEELEGRNREDFKYLVRKNEDENGSVLHGLANIGDGDDVVSELVTRKIREESRNSRLSNEKKRIFNVLMLSIDDIGELAAVDDLLEDPHLHLLVENGVLLDIFANQNGGGGTPRTRVAECPAYQFPEPMMATVSFLGRLISFEERVVGK